MMVPVLALSLSTSTASLPDASHLADAFNRAKGEVRVVMLVSPT